MDPAPAEPEGTPFAQMVRHRRAAARPLPEGKPPEEGEMDLSGLAAGSPGNGAKSSEKKASKVWKQRNKLDHGQEWNGLGQ